MGIIEAGPPLDPTLVRLMAVESLLAILISRTMLASEIAEMEADLTNRFHGITQAAIERAKASTGMIELDLGFVERRNSAVWDGVLLLLKMAQENQKKFEAGS